MTTTPWRTPWLHADGDIDGHAMAASVVAHLERAEVFLSVLDKMLAMADDGDFGVHQRAEAVNAVPLYSAAAQAHSQHALTLAATLLLFDESGESASEADILAEMEDDALYGEDAVR